MRVDVTILKSEKITLINCNGEEKVSFIGVLADEVKVNNNKLKVNNAN
jgi:ABC-type uncharacterized transport system ATPase component